MQTYKLTDFFTGKYKIKKEINAIDRLLNRLEMKTETTDDNFVKDYIFFKITKVCINRCQIEETKRIIKDRKQYLLIKLAEKWN